MFREMRRIKQALTLKESEELLKEGTSGVLAVSGDDGYPYAVPLNYMYHNNKLIFHCATTGHKLDGIKRNGKVSFCVILQDKIVPEEYTSYYKSVIVFGSAYILEDEKEKRKAFEMLAEKYSPNHREGRLAEIDRSINRVCIIELEVEHLSGKVSKELIETPKK